MIISITNLKGGVGKSTISQNIAICFAHMNYKVCLVDTDTNQTSMKWSSFRDESLPNIPVFGVTESNALTKSIKALDADYDIVFIDGRPSLSKITSKILLLSDLVIIPIVPSGADFWAMEPFLNRYEDAKELNELMKAFILCNRYDNRINLRKEVIEALDVIKQKYSIATLNTYIKQRVAYEEAMLKGIGVYEFKDYKAKAEIIQLTKEIESIILTL